MLRSLFGLAPQIEPDGSFRPSKLALKLATSPVTDYEEVAFETPNGPRKRVLVVFTEQKNMTMKNERQFSTGNHPVEALVPMLHLRNAGFAFDIATPSGKPVVFEMWAMPTKDTAVMELFHALSNQLKAPLALSELVETLGEETQYAAVFVPGGHGVMLGIPEAPSVGALLRWTLAQGIFTVSICHGPGALLATTLDGQPFPFKGYKMAVFPDAVDKQTPMIGYLPGHMPWELCATLEELGAIIVNTKADDTCCVDRTLITGASPAASQKLGVLAAKTLLDHVESTPVETVAP